MSAVFAYEEFTTRNIGFVTVKEQEKLRSSKVFVAGVGGMGGAAVACLARAGVGTLWFADLDTFEVSNLNRQLFATLDTVGRSKAEVTREGLSRINPEAQLRVFGAEWVEMLDELLPQVDVVINGCDDTRATVTLMRKAKQHGRTVIDAFASPLPNVYVVRPEDPRPEALFGYPTVGKRPEEIDKALAAQCLEKEIEWVMVHSSSAEHVDLEIAAEMVSGKRKRISFAPMVWSTGCLMAYEAIRHLLGRKGGPGPGGIFVNPWTHEVERPKNALVAAVRRVFVRRFLRSLAG